MTGGGWNLGCLGTIVVGVLGGLIGGMLFSAAGGEGIGDFGLRSMFVAFIAAVVLLVLAELFTGPVGAAPQFLDLGGGDAEVDLGSGAHWVAWPAASRSKRSADPGATCGRATLQRVGREHELGSVGVEHDDALTGRGVEHLHGALHVGRPRP